jgi:hypothetical protein
MGKLYSEVTESFEMKLGWNVSWIGCVEWSKYNI